MRQTTPDGVTGVSAEPWEAFRILANGGFEEIACYGNLDGGPFGADTRLVLVATAPAA